MTTKTQNSNWNNLTKLLITIGIITILLIFKTCSNAINANAQPITIYGTYQPADHGVGVKVDYYTFYGSMSYGKGSNYKTYKLGNHFKLTSGIILPVDLFLKSAINEYYRVYINAGLTYHNTSKYNKDVPYILFEPISYELGFSVKFDKWSFSCLTDIRRWEPQIGAGINLWRSYYRKRGF